MNLKSILLGVVVILSLCIFGGILFKKKMTSPAEQNWSFNNDWGTKKVEPKTEPKIELKVEEKKVEPKIEPKKKSSPRSCPGNNCPNQN